MNDTSNNTGNIDTVSYIPEIPSYDKREFYYDSNTPPTITFTINWEKWEYQKSCWEWNKKN